MKKIIILIFGILFAVFGAKAEFKCVINIKLQNNDGFSQAGFSFGAVSGATDSIDINLGEYEFPGGVTPGVNLTAMFNMDTINGGIFSYKDFRTVPTNSDYFMHQYSMYFSKGSGDTLDIIWGKLPDGIDSAIITDRLNGIIAYADMKKSTYLRTGNKILDNLIIKVWYNQKNTLVTDAPKNAALVLFPNPGSGIVNVKSNDEYKYYQIISASGEMVGSGEFNGHNVNLPELYDGVYSIKFINFDGSCAVARFVNLTK